MTPPAHRRGRGRTTVADGHKLSAVRRLNSQPVEKRNFYLPHLHLEPTLGVIPSEFRRDLLHRKTTVPWLFCGIVF